MDRVRDVPGAGDDSLGLRDPFAGSMNNQQELIGLKGNIILKNTVLWNSDTCESRPDRADASNNRRPFKACDDPATSGPATRIGIGPRPGIANIADPNNSPHNPPQNAPILPQYFIRSPVL
jgi:hypothetical protein